MPATSMSASGCEADSSHTVLAACVFLAPHGSNFILESPTLDKRKASVETQPPTALERGDISAYKSYYIASVESVFRASLCKTKRGQLSSSIMRLSPARQIPSQHIICI